MLRRELETASVATLILHDCREEHEYIAALCKWIYILTFAENNLCLTFECLLDTFERIYSAFASPTTTATAIVAKAELVSSWTIDTDLLDLVYIKRKDTVILEKGHALTCCLFCKFSVLLTTNNLCCVLLVYVRLLEKTELELDLEDATYRLIDCFLADLARLYEVEESVMSSHELKVETIVYTHCKCIFVCLCHIVTFVDEAYCTVVTYNVSVKAPLILKDVIEEFAVGAYRHSIDRVV